MPREVSFLLLLIFSSVVPLPAFAQSDSAQCQPHYGWWDSDGDRLPDIIEGARDQDNDGIPNYLDTDSDGDGIPDASEAYNSPAMAGSDSDQDGIDDAYDVDSSFTGEDLNGDGVTDDTVPLDTDQDGEPDFLDLDSDNDGLPDADEIDSASYYTDPDTDDDGLDDQAELSLGTRPDKFDTDDGGVSDWWEVQLGTDPFDAQDDHVHPHDQDLDDDGIPNDLEGTRDSDGDQIPDYLDLDSDNDGWFDILEANLPDLDADGRFDNATDDNNNGIADAAEGLLSTLPDQDNDGLPNSIDLDADNDGLGDAFEMQAIETLLSAGLLPLDIDNDGQPNNLDSDSDGDSIPDSIEAGYPDMDADGVTDLLNDADADGIPDSVDITFTQAPDDLDSDGDGIADRFDADDSIETITTTNWSTLEEETIVLPNIDIDADGIVDRHDPDQNGDGQVDEYYQQQYQPAELLTDADGDGLIALRDPDDTSAFVASAPASAPIEPDPQVPASPGQFVPAYVHCQTTDIVDTGGTTDPVSETADVSEGSGNDTAAIDSADPDSNETTDTPALGAATAGGGSGSAGLFLLALFAVFLNPYRKTAWNRARQNKWAATTPL